MTLTVMYPVSGFTRTHKNVDRKTVNCIITRISELNESIFVPVIFQVEE